MKNMYFFYFKQIVMYISAQWAYCTSIYNDKQFKVICYLIAIYISITVDT